MEHNYITNGVGYIALLAAVIEQAKKTDLSIGKNGKIAQAIRTIAYAGASKEGKKIKIDIDSF